MVENSGTEKIIGRRIIIKCIEAACVIITIALTAYAIFEFSNYLNNRRIDDVMSRIAVEALEQKEFSPDYVRWMATVCMNEELDDYTIEQKKNLCACRTEKQIKTFTAAELREAMRLDWNEAKVPDMIAKSKSNRSACTELVLQGE